MALSKIKKFDERNTVTGVIILCNFHLSQATYHGNRFSRQVIV